jgi:hypothetical protein
MKKQFSHISRIPEGRKAQGAVAPRGEIRDFLLFCHWAPYSMIGLDEGKERIG